MPANSRWDLIRGVKGLNFSILKALFYSNLHTNLLFGRSQGEVRRTEKGFMQCMENFVNTSWL